MTWAWAITLRLEIGKENDWGWMQHLSQDGSFEKTYPKTREMWSVKRDAW